MYIVNEDSSIYVTRGDTVFLTVSAAEDGAAYKFQPGDVVRIKVFEKKACENVVLQKDFSVVKEAEAVDLFLTGQDTRIGEIISKPVDYWYEVELNPDTNPQTVIGYDDNGAKLFKLMPAGREVDEDIITEEDIPIVDKKLDLHSTRPVQNQVIAREISVLNNKMDSHTHTKADITNFPSSMPASDVYSWAKAKSKPAYTASEVGARPDDWMPTAEEIGAVSEVDLALLKTRVAALEARLGV
jgi:hypothetical protein